MPILCRGIIVFLIVLLSWCVAHWAEHSGHDPLKFILAMPWMTPTLAETRQIVRDDVTAALRGAQVVGNTVLRVMCDAMAGLCALILRYLDWLARQLMPDLAEHEWLSRFGDIWLQNADGSLGRKNA
ncbi:MAG: hypothetical protein C5B54_07260, partial [Acidobacteria bacterium]